MLNNKEIKEWYSKNEILELYPIGLSTYKKRIKKLNSPPYKSYSRILNKSIDNSNLKSIQYREIHKSILDELFGNVRVPNLKNTSKVIKWVNNNTWNWFGNIIPSKTNASELIGKMNYVFSELKKLNKECKVTLYYSIEKNTEDEYYHSHFLIKNEFCTIPKNEIIEILELVAEKNTPKETRIYVKPYDYKNFGNDGSSYTLKDFKYGYEILK
jgi:hypothetical protein